MRKHLVCLVLASAIACAAFADHWPSWRGADFSGRSRETNLPTTWSATEHVRWKVPLPGPGMSSPIVWGDRIFLTQALDRAGHERALLCFDRASGKELWREVVPYADTESTYQGDPHFCSASPVTDGTSVVASFGSAGVICTDLSGKRLWHRDLGKCEQIWGNAASPVLYENLVILNFGPGERTFLIALDRRTGKDVWRVEIPDGRYGKSPEEWIGSWSTPVVARGGGSGDELIMTWPGAVVAYNPNNGAELWRCGGLGKLVYTSPLVTPDLIVAMSGFGGPALAVRRGGAKGDVTATHRLWREERSPQRIGSGVIVGEHVFILNDGGTLQCVEVKTGRTLWNERIGLGTWGSTSYAEGKLYVINKQGETTVLAAKPELEVLSRNVLAEQARSSPAFSNGEIFIRTYSHLWCIGK
jgi:outer membrane protein assembly factor BamB